MTVARMGASIARVLRAVSAVGVLGLGGCAAIGVGTSAAEPEDMPDMAFNIRKGEGGGVFVRGSQWSLTSDSRAFRIGDVLTVELQEATQASKKSDTSIGKSSSAVVTKPRVWGAEVPIDAELGGKRDFSGSGASSQQNALRGSLTVIVQNVLPNGLLQVRGDKKLMLNQGEETVRLSGYVRAADIGTDNRVSSQRVANARIQYSSKGSLADANEPGWLTRFFNSPWFPF
jgi:flagellar L-ring protein precursor FlgH